MKEAERRALEFEEALLELLFRVLSGSSYRRVPTFPSQSLHQQTWERYDYMIRYGVLERLFRLGGWRNISFGSEKEPAKNMFDVDLPPLIYTDYSIDITMQYLTKRYPDPAKKGAKSNGDILFEYLFLLYAKDVESMPRNPLMMVAHPYRYPKDQLGDIAEHVERMFADDLRPYLPWLMNCFSWERLNERMREDVQYCGVTRLLLDAFFQKTKKTPLLWQYSLFPLFKAWFSDTSYWEDFLVELDRKTTKHSIRQHNRRLLFQGLEIFSAMYRVLQRIVQTPPFERSDSDRMTLRFARDSDVMRLIKKYEVLVSQIQEVIQ